MGLHGLLQGQLYFFTLVSHESYKANYNLLIGIKWAADWWRSQGHMVRSAGLFMCTVTDLASRKREQLVSTASSSTKIRSLVPPILAEIILPYVQ
jgi:hypothetical protein